MWGVEPTNNITYINTMISFNNTYESNFGVNEVNKLIGPHKNSISLLERRNSNPFNSKIIQTTSDILE